MKSEAINVLLIDDDEDDYILTRELLSEVKVGKYTLDWASSYEEGLEIIRRREHDVCLVDYSLGERSGVEFIRESREYNLNIPMILLTGQGSHDVDVEAMRAGAMGYLIKDETPTSRLERTIRYAVKRSEEHSRAEKTLEAHARRQDVVAEIGRLALMGGELADLFEVCVSLVAQALDLDFCRVLEILPDNDVLILRAAIGEKDDCRVGQTISTSPEFQAGYTLDAGEPVVVEDFRVETRFKRTPLLHEQAVVSGMSVVIRGRKGNYGVLSAHSLEERCFDADELGFQVAVANVLAEAIERKRAAVIDVAHVVSLNKDITEGKRIEAKLAANETLLKQFVAYTPTAIAMLDDEMRYLQVSERWLADFHLLGQNIIGKLHYDVFPLSPEKWTEAIRRTLNGEVESCDEDMFRRPDGTIEWMQWETRPWYKADGVAGGMIFFTQIITKRKQDEEAMRKSEERFELVTRATKDAVWDWNLVTDELWWNKGFQTMFGYTADEVGSGIESWTERLHPDDLRWIDEEIHGAIESGQESWSGEYRFLRADGTYALVVDRGYVVRDELGKPVRMLGAMMDVTEARRIERELEQASRRESALISNALDLICSFDSEGRFVSVNPASLKVLGYTPEELIGQRFIEFVAPADVEKTKAEDASIISGTETTDFENRYLHKNGSLVQMMWTSYWSDSEQLVFAVARDITSRKQIEVELEDARDAALASVRLKAEFLANMSHEIRTPMNGVIGMTGLLLGTDLSSRQQEYTGTIQSSAEDLLRIIDDILDFSKIEAGQLRFEKIDFDLRGAVEAPVELLAERAHAKGLELACLVHHDVYTALNGDPGRLRQVLTNLIGNAVKFTDHGEVVVNATNVTETASHTILRFEIKDTGIGISKDAKRGLFQAFTQADGSTTRKYGGTGLGLAISKQLVELMDGEIGVESTLGHGSTFWFTAKFEKQSVVAAAVIEPAHNLYGSRVLIVDDNETNRRILVHQTNSWGMRPDEAESGQQTLDLLRAGVRQGAPYDIALLDLMMPSMNGFELADAIKADPEIAGVRLVLLPSFGKRGDGKRATQAGIAAYLQKPVRQSQLYDCLAQLMATPNRGEVQIPRLISRHSMRESEVFQRDKTASGIRILVAEDNPVNQMVALGQLENLGYQVEVVSNGHELLEALNKEPADIILMDCQMPQMDGFEATAMIRQREGEARHTTIIAMTANALAGDDQKCMAAGMDDYLSKPVKPDVLRRKLEQWTKPINSEKNSSVCAEPVMHLQGGILDKAQLDGLKGIKQPGLFTVLIDLFFNEATTQLRVLEEAHARKDMVELSRVAHCLRGCSANIGATRMAAIAEALERGDPAHDVRELLAQLAKEFALVRAALMAERLE